MISLHAASPPPGPVRLLLALLAAGVSLPAEPSPAAPEAPAAAAVAETAQPPPAAPDAAAEAASLLRLAASLTERAEYPAAEVAYRQVLTQRRFAASQRDALIGLARMYRKQGVLTKAAAIYEKFLKAFPDDARTPEALLELGRTLRAMGAHRLAIARFYSVINSTLKISPSDPDHYQLLARTAQFEIAETHFEAGNYAESGKFFTRLRLLDLAPADRARAHFKAAYAQQLAGDREGAVATLRTYLDEWPGDDHAPEAAYLLATTLRQLGRLEESLAVTHRLLQDARDHATGDPQRWAYWQRRTGNQLANDFFQNGHLAGALGLYESLAKLSADPAWRLPITYQVGLCHEKLHDPPRAEAAYRTVIGSVEALGATAPAELREFARMAAWRLDNLAWQNRTSRQLTAFFATEPARKIHDTPASPPTAPEAL